VAELSVGLFILVALLIAGMALFAFADYLSESELPVVQLESSLARGDVLTAAELLKLASFAKAGQLGYSSSEEEQLYQSLLQNWTSRYNVSKSLGSIGTSIAPGAGSYEISNETYLNISVSGAAGKKEKK